MDINKYEFMIFNYMNTNELTFNNIQNEYIKEKNMDQDTLKSYGKTRFLINTEEKTKYNMRPNVFYSWEITLPGFVQSGENINGIPLTTNYQIKLLEHNKENLYTILKTKDLKK